MLNNILDIGRTGMNSMQKNMDSIAVDVSNVNTDGYKKKQISFQELLNNDILESEVLLNTQGKINVGTKSQVNKIDHTQGILYETGTQTHMAIEGRGFFGVRDGQGNLLLTRNGSFHRNLDGSIANQSGLPLEIEEIVPMENWAAEDFNIDFRGNVTSGSGDEQILLARIPLFVPESEENLVTIGETLYVAPENIALYNSFDNPEEFGKINQGFLEESNVELAQSMADMIATQRAYSLNAKTIHTTDDIMGIINNIK